MCAICMEVQPVDETAGINDCCQASFLLPVLVYPTLVYQGNTCPISKARFTKIISGTTSGCHKSNEHTVRVLDSSQMPCHAFSTLFCRACQWSSLIVLKLLVVDLRRNNSQTGAPAHCLWIAVAQVVRRSVNYSIYPYVCERQIRDSLDLSDDSRNRAELEGIYEEAFEFVCYGDSPMALVVLLFYSYLSLLIWVRIKT